MFLEDLFFEIGDVNEKELVEPHMSILTGDTVVGEVPMELKKLYTLMIFYEGQFRANIQTPTILEAAQGMGYGPRAQWLMQKADVLKHLFFLCLYDVVCKDYSWPYHELAVRKGWKAVREP